MRQIIDNVLYDTDTSELLYLDSNTKRRYFKTENGRYFVAYANGVIQIVTEDFMRSFLGKWDIDKYIEVFGEPIEG